MAAWCAEHDLDDAAVKPMRDEWSPAALATALESERKGGTPLTEAQAADLRAELRRIRTLAQSAVTVIIQRPAGPGATGAPSRHPSRLWAR